MFLSVVVIPPDVPFQRQLTAIHIERWLREDVFTFRWWLLLVLLTLSLYLWWKIVDKKRLPEIMLYTMLTMIVVMAKVEYGQELTLWDYPTDILPIFPPLTSIELISMPLIYSLVYQFFRGRKSFIWATLITTAIVCFILEPLMAWGELYELLHWEYYLNYPLYAAMAIGVGAVVNKISAITEKHADNKK